MAMPTTTTTTDPTASLRSSVRAWEVTADHLRGLVEVASAEVGA